MLSVVIPSRNEKYLNNTITEVLLKSKGRAECIVVLEGYWSEPIDGVTYIHHGQAIGMRTSINQAVAIAKGDYIMKLDAHCMLDDDFDLKILEGIQDDWIVVPRRKRLDAENWSILEVKKPDVDYEYISNPKLKGIKGQIWTKRIIERQDILIDENMTFQGSCWVTSKKHYQNIGGLNPQGYGEFVREAQELSLKTWLSGGKVMTNKKTWYAHLHKGPKHGRGYMLNKPEMIKGEQYCDNYWMNTKEYKHDFKWLIDRFSPVPDWNFTVGVVSFDTNQGIKRIISALKQHSPEYVSFTTPDKASVIFLIATGDLNRNMRLADYYKDKPLIVFQAAVKTTKNPNLDDWQELWSRASLVWSYCDLGKLQNFYRSPLGVEHIFKRTSIQKDYLITVVSNGYLTESTREVIHAAKDFGRVAVVGDIQERFSWVDNYNNITDEQLAQLYQRSIYVSGLRRHEGFELPALEGLFCGATPIVFEYNTWFKDCAVFIKETNRDGIIESLREVFTNQPTTQITTDIITRFDWHQIISKLWRKFT